MEELNLQREKLEQLAKEAASLTQSDAKRGEVLWLEQRYEELVRKQGISGRMEADAFIAREMETNREKAAGYAPAAEAIKIRYWRTGRHYPKKRSVCEAFGRALKLDDADMKYLLTAWFDRADLVFGPGDEEDPRYKERRRLLSELQQEFYGKQRPEELLAIDTEGRLSDQNLRHIYCCRAVRYLGEATRRNLSEFRSHLDTRGYEYEFSREMRLYGEVSRTAMIRHLLILGMPFVNRNRVNLWLGDLGYLPLDPSHRQVGGAASDLLILGLLEEYERECTGMDPELCTEWFMQAAGILDDALCAAGCGQANPFRFKHILGGQSV